MNGPSGEKTLPWRRRAREREREGTTARRYVRQRSPSTGLTGLEPLTGGLQEGTLPLVPSAFPFPPSLPPLGVTNLELTKESTFFLSVLSLSSNVVGENDAASASESARIHAVVSRLSRFLGGASFLREFSPWTW